MVTSRPEKERPWWQLIDISAFRSRIGASPYSELGPLELEIQGSIENIEAQLDARDEGEDVDWFRRIHAARGYILEKKRILQAEMLRRKPLTERVAQLIKSAMSKVGMPYALPMSIAEDLQKALAIIEKDLQKAEG